MILTGASAGGFGAGLNYGMVQDTFTTKIPVTVIDDSGPPFSAQYLPACLQKIWRNLWGFDAVLPSDCAECFNADGSGLTNIVYYWLQKYPTAKVGVVTTMEDEVIRLFFSQSLNSCASNNATALTVGQALCGGYTCAQYTAGINDLLGTFQCTGRVAGYLIGGANPNYMNPTYHQHIFRDEFYQAITDDGGITMAQWASDFASGKLENRRAVIPFTRPQRPSSSRPSTHVDMRIFARPRATVRAASTNLRAASDPGSSPRLRAPRTFPEGPARPCPPSC